MDGTELSKPKRPRLEYPLGQTVPAIGEMKEVAPGKGAAPDGRPKNFSSSTILYYTVRTGGDIANSIL